MNGNANSAPRLLATAVAAFGVYFCMYAFRKPFTAGTFADQELFGFGLKTALVVAQLLGYVVSKFIGVKIISEMPSRYRVVTIAGLIGFSELALVGFAYAPMPIKPMMLFFNGLPLGMIFGLVLGFLEGRKQTEALSAALCASFIVSSGVVKSVGRWLIADVGVSEFQMPMWVGLIFLPPLFVALAVLQSTPPPDQDDRRLRRERNVMTGQQRKDFFLRYWPGLCLLFFVYIALTIARTVRDDFAVEIWQGLGIDQQPSIHATSETIVAVIITALSGMAACFRDNILAMRITTLAMMTAFVVVSASAMGIRYGLLSPIVFMVACGVGLYVPYVLFHTTVFERLIAASKVPSNLGFLIYIADSLGYLGYAVVMLLPISSGQPHETLPFFGSLLITVAVVSIAALAMANGYFRRTLAEPSL
ncbi:DUF5690 family protein [Rubripirellula lacrimiformis]|uniref:DUF5690 family protein n=1 Tax=Rubripirellula lacrimiformis TaxID=1930273 RepID=UPI0011A022EB|nr:DUF5690 family protein [Rubripirellula lacrimiformis]